ncbi:MAG: hypothetical protein SGPRY_000124 [Prymnesium sp.]
MPALRATLHMSSLSKRVARRSRRSGKKATTAVDASTSDGAYPLREELKANGPKDASQLVELARHYRKLNQPRQLVKLYESSHSSGIEASESVVHVTRSLLRLSRTDLALQLLRTHLHSHGLSTPSTAICRIFLALCRERNLEEAKLLLRSVEDLGACSRGPLPSSGEDPKGEPLEVTLHSTMLPAFSIALLAEGNSAEATAAMARVSRPTRNLGLIREFGKLNCLRGVYVCLDVMRAAELKPDADNLQVLVNALVKSCRFVTGGVSMNTLPAASLPEVAFIGRSNVGKSSLVNMVLGRNAIAYTSKTPGKTQQYNYFLVNGGREDGEFHLVDMPGLGFAKAPFPHPVPSAVRKQWSSFLKNYMRSRTQLRLFIHLIDGEVGPKAVDLQIMEMVAEVSQEERDWEYAVILTKVDKAGEQASLRAAAAVKEAVDLCGCHLGDRLIRTSARSKFGRHDAWRLLRPVMLPIEEQSDDALAPGE